MKKIAFTLAEVLITLGIIGIVAAMTLPTLIQSNKNKEVEAKLKKIYSVMNQAILLSEKDNGPKEYWPQSCKDDTCEDFYKTYFLPYLSSIRTLQFSGYGGYNIAIYFNDGTLLVGKAITDWYFFPNAKNFDKDTFAVETENGGVVRKDCGTTYFAFRFTPWAQTEANRFHYKKGFEPYRHSLAENTTDSLTEGPYGCGAASSANVFCTAIILNNGWQIPDDYPFKVK